MVWILAGCGAGVDEDGRSCSIDGSSIEAREANDRVAIDLRSGEVSFRRFDGQQRHLAMRNLRRLEDRYEDQHLLQVLIEDDRTLMAIADRTCIAALDVIMRPSAEAQSRSQEWADAMRAHLEAGNATAAYVIAEEAASAGLDWAQAALGLMLKNGEGVPADPQQAVVWFERASSQNHPDAHYHLAGLYAQGHGGEDGKRRAMFKLESAVSMNHEAATHLHAEWRKLTAR